MISEFVARRGRNYFHQTMHQTTAIYEILHRQSRAKHQISLPLILRAPIY
jgi:hypothetical protein